MHLAARVLVVCAVHRRLVMVGDVGTLPRCGLLFAGHAFRTPEEYLGLLGEGP